MLCMKAVNTDLGSETLACGFKKAGAKRTLPFLPFLLKCAIVAREKSHPAIPTKSLALSSPAHVK